MHTPTNPILIVSDDLVFGNTLQHQLEHEGYVATVQRTASSTPDTLAAQQPALLVVHAANGEPSSVPADALAEQFQEVPGMEGVPVIVCAEHRAVRQEMVKHLCQHRGTVVASSSQAGEVRAKLHELDASSMHG